MSTPGKRAREEVTPVLLDYTDAVLRVAEEEQADLVDIHTLFQSNPDEEAALFVLDDDPVHPSPLGHARIAEALLPVVRAALPQPETR